MSLARRDIKNTDDLKILDLVFLHPMSIPSNRYSDSVYIPPYSISREHSTVRSYDDHEGFIHPEICPFDHS